MPSISIKTAEEIEKLREGGHILSLILKKICKQARPGITTKELDQLARELMKKYEVQASFLDFGHPPYPATLCASVNEEVVHCIPGERILKEGDIIGLDCGIWHKKLCTDMAITVAIGKISATAKKLIKVTKESLDLAIKQIKEGAVLGDIGYAIQSHAEKNGFSVVRRLVGHGVGYQVHEPPKIPNYGQPGAGETLKAGMVLAIEPMVNAGHHDIEVTDNGWNIVTKDRSLSAHFEHTVVVTKNGCEILTK